MATRHKSGGDSKKLLTKTYSEIGVANNSQAETPTPSEKVEFLVKSSFWKLEVWIGAEYLVHNMSTTNPQ